MSRQFSLKSFIKKSASSKNAIGFINQHREFLTTGEVASITSPIVHKVDIGYLDPAIGLEQITNAMFAHMMVIELQKAEDKLKAAAEPVATKPVIAKIISLNGEEISNASFVLHQDAERWVDNRLYSGYPGSHGEVIHTKILIKGEPQIMYITREDAIARILRKPKSVATKKIGANNSKLGFVGRARNSQAHFSRG